MAGSARGLGAARSAASNTMPLNSLSNSSLQANTRRCRRRSDGAEWMKLTLIGRHCAPMRALHIRKTTPKRQFGTLPDGFVVSTS